MEVSYAYIHVSIRGHTRCIRRRSKEVWRRWPKNTLSIDTKVCDNYKPSFAQSPPSSCILEP